MCINSYNSGLEKDNFMKFNSKLFTTFVVTYRVFIFKQKPHLTPLIIKMCIHNQVLILYNTNYSFFIMIQVNNLILVSLKSIYSTIHQQINVISTLLDNIELYTRQVRNVNCIVLQTISVKSYYGILSDGLIWQQFFLIRVASKFIRKQTFQNIESSRYVVHQVQ